MKFILSLIVLSWAVTMQRDGMTRDQKKEQVDRWIKDLDSNKLKIRDEATEQLIRHGQPALEAVRKALEHPPSPEVRWRAEKIVRKISAAIRWGTREHGEEVCGLEAALYAGKTEFRPDETMTITLEIMNVGLRPREYVPIASLNRDFPCSSYRSSAAHGLVTVEQKSGTVPELMTLTVVAACGLSPRRNAIILESGQSSTYTIEIKPGEFYSDETLHRAGEFEIQAVYFAMTENMVPDAPEDLKSNTVRFKISENPVKKE